MPGWLVHMEMERDPETWISRAVRHGWISEAVGWTRQLLRDVSLYIFQGNEVEVGLMIDNAPGATSKGKVGSSGYPLHTDRSGIGSCRGGQ
jgi:hypothetical protein